MWWAVGVGLGPPGGPGAPREGGGGCHLHIVMVTLELCVCVAKQERRSGLWKGAELLLCLGSEEVRSMVLSTWGLPVRILALFLPLKTHTHTHIHTHTHTALLYPGL